MIENIDTIRKNAIAEIKEKTKKNPGPNGYMHPCNKERREDIRKLGFENGFEFVRWSQQNGILRNPTKVDRDYYAKIAKKKGFNNINEYTLHNWRCRNYAKDIEDNQKLHPQILHKKGSVKWFKEKIKINSGPFGYLHQCNKELQEDMKTFGFDTIKNLVNWIKNSEKEDRFYEKLESDFGKEFAEWAKENRKNVLDYWLYAGCKTAKEYYDKRAQKFGYKNSSERTKIMRWDQGIHEPMSENKKCSSFLGVYIGEYTLKEFLLTIFEHVEKMDYGNSGFDFICKNPTQDFTDKYHRLKLVKNKEYKIELKSRCLQYVGKRIGWNFTGIDRGNASDIFILIGLDNIESLIPQHMWIFDKNDVVRGKEFWDRYCFYITDRPKYLNEFKKYELVDELDILKELCNKRINEIN